MLSIHASIYLSVCLSVCLSIDICTYRCLSGSLYLHIYVYLSLCLHISLSLPKSINLSFLTWIQSRSMYLSISQYLFLFLPVSLPPSLSLSLSPLNEIWKLVPILFFSSGFFVCSSAQDWISWHRNSLKKLLSPPWVMRFSSRRSKIIKNIKFF